MKLIELNPHFERRVVDQTTLSFDCPVCKMHRLDIPVGGAGWDMTGGSFTYNDITLMPSIAHDAPAHNCKSHFFIKNGEIELV